MIHNSETMQNIRRINAMVEKQFAAYRPPTLNQPAHQSELANALVQWINKSN